MIPMYNEPCPIDGSELIFLNGNFVRQGQFDVASYYCPRCDAGFVCWSNPAYDKPVIFTWRRKGSELILDETNAPKVSDYLSHDWEAAQSNMLHGVRCFLEARYGNGRPTHCPNDGGKIPLVAELPCHERSTVRFSWCVFCGELFAFLKDEDYGWQDIMSFSHDRHEYKLWKTFRTSPFAEIIRERAASLPLPSEFEGKMKGPIMEQPEQPIRKPSVFIYSMAGYLIASAFGIAAVAVMSMRAGDYHEPAAFQVLVCAGAIGAFIGFEFAARRLKAFGGGGMAEEWKRFWGSLPCYGLGAIVLGGSAAITVLGTLIAIAVMGPIAPK